MLLAPFWAVTVAYLPASTTNMHARSTRMQACAHMQPCTVYLEEDLWVLTSPRCVSDMVLRWGELTDGLLCAAAAICRACSDYQLVYSA